MNSTHAKVVAIVPAAGIGSRMQAEVPKQYLLLANQTIIAHTLDTLLAHPSIDEVIVALNPEDSFFASLPQANHPKLRTVLGGKERADSVLAGLSILKAGAWALVHDAARPCLTSMDIDKLLDSRRTNPQGAILATPVRDTMKRANANGNIDTTVCRENLWHALTPQLFPAERLMKNLSLALAEQAVITDEASAMEWAGEQPALIPGRADNIKVTRPDDLALAELFLSQQDR